MSLWRTKSRAYPGQVRLLREPDRPALLALAREDPVRNLFVLSRVQSYGIERRTLGCDVYGYVVDGRLHSALHVGANVVPVAMDDSAQAGFVEKLGPARRASSIMGPGQAVRSLHAALSERWGDTWGIAREVRAHQPLLVIDHEPVVAPDPRVRRITLAEFDSYLDASVRMYTEEVGVSPLGSDPRSYASHVRRTITEGRAFGIVENGRVIYKSDIGAQTDDATQIQGVWLDPRLRGRSISTGAMAGVVRLCREVAPICSLYVNDFNAPARALYARVGFRHLDEFATVLY